MTHLNHEPMGGAMYVVQAPPKTPDIESKSYLLAHWLKDPEAMRAHIEAHGVFGQTGAIALGSVLDATAYVQPHNLDTLVANTEQPDLISFQKMRAHDLQRAGYTKKPLHAVPVSIRSDLMAGFMEAAKPHGLLGLRPQKDPEFRAVIKNIEKNLASAPA